MRRLQSSRAQGHGSRDRWLVSYTDFITLLFAFFATLYATSSLDARKLQSIARGMQVAFDDPSARQGQGVLPEHEALVPRDASTAGVEAALGHDFAAELASQQLELIVDRRGVTLSIPESGAFAVGRDELSDTAQQLVARIAATLAPFPNPVRVEGHTDDVPIHNLRFASNWDLSAARASRVVEFLIGRGFAAARLSATGYAEFHPRLPNASDAARASNRRIDLVILNAAAVNAEEPAHAETAHD